MSKVLIIGGAGYVGSALCPLILASGHEVTVLDTFWFGDQLPAGVRKVKGDMRDIKLVAEVCRGQDVAIHLACISNDPSFELNPSLGKSINLDCFPSVLTTIRDARIKKFIYASSSSVYGVHKGQVTENSECRPLTDYSKFKWECEKILRQTYMGSTIWTIVRPATVCGWAPRLRLDVVVNAMSASALKNRVININGGTQLRPNIHIVDMCRAYQAILTAPKTVTHEKIYNVGGENIKLVDIGRRIARVLSTYDIQMSMFDNSNDPRSYHINSDRIKGELEFEAKASIEDAALSLKVAYEDGLIKDITDSRFINVKRMKEIYP